MEATQAQQEAAEQLVIGSVTGVDVMLNVAGPGARAFAFVVDWHIRLVLFLAWLLGSGYLLFGTVAFFEAAEFSDLSFSVFVIGPATILYFLYHPVLEIVMRGSTPGKRIAGVRIVTEDGGQPGVFALLLRNVLRILDSLPSMYIVGLVSTMVTQRSVRIGDIAAGTILVYETQARQDLSGTLASYHDQGDMQLQDLTRELVGRWDALSPERRTAMGRKLVAQIEPELNVQTLNDERVFARLQLFLKLPNTSA